MAIGKFLAPLNGPYIQQQVNKPYVDDLFDPLFNRAVVDYYNQLYGNRILGTMAGYADMWDNALTGRKGILGPGMGILSTFGRTMDKADDFILGGITEGVNALGSAVGGSGPAPTNPISNIFQEDQNYTGTRLLASIANATSRMAGMPGVALDEGDFNTFGDNLAGTVIDLATDPGIAGGQLARLNKGTPVGQVGQIMSNYDDLMANVAGNTAIPGGKALAGKAIERIANFVGHNSAQPFQDTTTKTFDPDLNLATYSDIDTPDIQHMKDKSGKWYKQNLEALQAKGELVDELDNIVYNYDINPIEDPEIFKLYEDTRAQLNLDDITRDMQSQRRAYRNFTNPGAFANTPDELADLADYEARELDQNLTNLIYQMDAYRGNARNKIYNLMESYPELFSTQTDITTTKRFGNPEQVEDYYSKLYGHNKALSASDIKNLSPEAREEYAKNASEYYSTMHTILKDAGLPDDINDPMRYDKANGAAWSIPFTQAANKYWYTNNRMYDTKPFFVKYSKAYVSEQTAKYTLPIIEKYTKDLIDAYPRVFSRPWLVKQFPDLTNNINSFRFRDHVDDLYKFSADRNKLGASNYLGYEFKYDNYQSLLNAFSMPDRTGFIDFIKMNEATLQKTEEGRALIDYADKITNVLDTVNPKQLDTGIARDLIKWDETEDLSLDPVDMFNNLISSKTPRASAIRVAQELEGAGLQVYVKNPTTGKLEKFIYNNDGTPYKLNNDAFSGLTQDIYNELAIPGTKDVSLKADAIAAKLTAQQFTPNEYAKVIIEPKTFNDYTVQSNVVNPLFDEFCSKWNLPSDLPMGDLEHMIRNFGTPKQQRLFILIKNAVDSKVYNNHGVVSGVENLQEVQEVYSKAKPLLKKYTPETIAKYIDDIDKEFDLTISKDDFMRYLMTDGEVTYKTSKFTKETAPVITDAYNKIKQNVSKVNNAAGGEVLEPFFIHVNKGKPDHSILMGYRFKADNFNIKKEVGKIYGLFGKKLDLEDVLLQKGTGKHIEGYDDLDEFFGLGAYTGQGVSGVSARLATTIGFKPTNINYIKHAMLEDENSQKFWSGLLQEKKTDQKALRDIVDALQQYDIANRGAFGSIEYMRTNLGDFSEYAPGLSTDLKYIASSTFTKGMLGDTNAQTFFDMFLTDNFKVNKQFQNADTLIKALKMKDATGKYYGNLQNLDLVKPIYKEGRIVGFKKWDKLSDTAIRKAFDDPDTVLLPTQAFGHLDRLCKKDLRMTNKVYAFINKYLTVPFKFGTLANPGFLVGNIEDAYFKQAVLMSKQYGTTMEDELTNVAMSMREVTILNNQMTDVLDNYKTWLRSTSDEAFKYSKNNVDKITLADIVEKDKFRNEFLVYTNTIMPESERRISSLYNFINSRQATSMFNNNNLDIEDVKNNMRDNINKYDVPTNPIERLFYGNPTKKGFRSWGLFLNNPVSNKVIGTSNTIENWMRSACILNDFKHKGITSKQIQDILELPASEESKLYENLKIQMADAVNTMNTANFDYDNVSGFMDKASYVIPFPTFYLKNIAYWADIFVSKPQLIDNVISTHEGLWGNKSTKDEFVAEAKGRGAIPIGQQNKHLTGIVKQTPYNSMFGAFNAVNNFKDDALYRLNPVTRPVTRHLQRNDDVRYRPYNTNPFQKNIKQGDKEFNELSYMFHQLNPYERAINTGLRTPGKFAKNDYQLSDFLPSMFQPDFKK